MRHCRRTTLAASACSSLLLALLGCAADPATWRAYQDAGEAALLRGGYERAGVLLERAGREAEQLGPAERAHTRLTEVRLARDLHELDRAEAAYDETIRLLLEARAESSLEAAILEIERGWLLLARGQPDAAASVFLRARRHAERTSGRTTPTVAWASLGLAEARAEASRSVLARHAVERALVLFQGDPTRASVPVGTVRALTLRAQLTREAGDPALARSDVIEAIRLGRRALTLDHPRIGDALLELARADLALGDAEAARESAERALEIASKRLPEGHPKRAEAKAVLRACSDPSAGSAQ